MSKLGGDPDIVAEVTLLKEGKANAGRAGKRNATQGAQRTVNPVQDPAQTAGKTEESPLLKARKGAGLDPAGDRALQPGESLTLASAADAAYVVETVENLKAALVGLVAARANVPESDPELARIRKLSFLLKAALEAHAPWLAPLLREKVGSGRWMLYAAALLEAINTFKALGILAQKYNPKKAEKPGDDAQAGDKAEPGSKASPAPAPDPRFPRDPNFPPKPRGGDLRVPEGAAPAIAL